MATWPVCFLAVETMPIPTIIEGPDLPAGIHRASLTEVIGRFGGKTAQRKIIGARLERIYRVASATGHLYRFVVFGSFVTRKAHPNDVDIFMLMEDSFDAGSLTGEAAILFDHGAADSYWGASVFWLRRLAAFEGEDAAIEHWQIRRDGGRRGIVEIEEELYDLQ